MRTFPSFVFCAVALCAPLVAQAQLDADALREYGGRYAVDCADPSKPRVVVTASALAVEQGTQRMSAGALQASVSTYGQNPPDGFLVELMGEVRGGLSLSGLVMVDARGAYLTLEGDPKVSRALGTLTRMRFDDCDATRVRRRIAQHSAAQADERRDAAQRGVDAKSAFGSAYRSALAALAREPWLAEVASLPDSPGSRQRIAGTEYRVEKVCKPHDCHDNNLIVLYAPSTGAIYGKLLVKLRPTFIGNPPPEMQRTLERLWRAAWRQGG